MEIGFSLAPSVEWQKKYILKFERNSISVSWPRSEENIENKLHYLKK